jgi:hypothetical protein
MRTTLPLPAFSFYKSVHVLNRYTKGSFGTEVSKENAEKKSIIQTSPKYVIVA